MIIVEITFRESGDFIISEPLETTKDEFLAALGKDSYIDFPVKLKDDLGTGTFCISTYQIDTQCCLLFRDD